MKDAVAIALVLHPLADILIAIFVVVGTLAVFLAVEPAAFVFFVASVIVHAEPRLPIFEPLPIIHRPTFVLVDPPTMLPPLTKLPLVFIALGKQINTIAMELIVLPEAQVHICIREGVDSPAMPALDDLADILGAVVVAELLELRFELTVLFVELAGEFLFEAAGLVEGFGVLRVVGGGVVVGVLVLDCRQHMGLNLNPLNYNRGVVGWLKEGFNWVVDRAIRVATAKNWSMHHMHPYKL